MKKFILTAGFLLAAFSAHAKDGWEGRPHVCDMAPGPTLEKCQTWIDTVLRPDTRTSCCKDADAYIVDNFKIVDGQLIAIIGADYPGDEYGNGQYARGTEIVIPPEKVNHDPADAGNVSGHGALFMSAGQVLCFTFPPLT